MLTLPSHFRFLGNGKSARSTLKMYPKTTSPGHILVAYKVKWAGNSIRDSFRTGAPGVKKLQGSQIAHTFLKIPQIVTGGPGSTGVGGAPPPCPSALADVGPVSGRSW